MDVIRIRGRQGEDIVQSEGAVAARGVARRGATGRSLAGRLVAWLLEGYGRPPIRFVLWTGEEVSASRGPAVATVHLRDRGIVWELLLDPDLAFGDGYVEGRIQIEGDLVRLLEAVFDSSESARAPRFPGLLRLLRLQRPRRSLGAARRNVHHHYDVGNDFYRLWLDERMVYTCAYFSDPDASLEDAQIAKMDHVCRKLRLRPGEEVVEAGCGWGALALHMAERYGARVTAYNVSTAQVAYAREEARRRGLSDRVEFVQADWRRIEGRYDVFVSVGMLEHVGLENYPLLGQLIARSLRPDGRGLVHSIGRTRPRRMSSWILRRIFPGSYIPSLGEMTAVFEPEGLAVLDVENLRPHYARTLEHWLARLERAADRAQDLHGERLLRTYRLYLASSIASFRSGSCQLYQILFSRAANDRIPLTRADVYGDR